LFYALSQAGRAISAAHRDDEHWQHGGHGLTVDSPTEKLHATVRAVGGRATSFRIVRETVGSRPIRSPVELGALLAGLPESADLAWDRRWPRALRVYPHQPDTLSMQVLSADVVLTADRIEPGRWSDSVRDALAAYPTTSGFTSRVHPFTDGDDILHGTLAPTSVVLRWPTGTAPGERDTRMEMIAPQHRFAGTHWLWPSLHPTDTVILSPLMTWWALLFGFSILARYEPATWVSMLNVDLDPYAVAIENALNEGLTTVPHLVRDAVLGESLLLPSEPHRAPPA
jgi:hypothetical protein